MRNYILMSLLVLTLNSARAQTERHVLPLTVANSRSHITVRLGDLTIPHILLDTGFAFDGLMIYNPLYIDSLDLSAAVQVQIGGAGSGENSRGLMIPAADFSSGSCRFTGQRVIMLQGDSFKGFHSNGIIGYSLFGHYITEFNYDRNEMILHDSAAFQPPGHMTAVPLYFKENHVPWVDVQISVTGEAPVTAAAYIDYAAGEAVLLLEKEHMKFTLPAVTEKAFIGRGLSGDIYGRKTILSSLRIGPAELQNIEAMIADEAVRSRQPDGDLILGHGSLSRYNFIFDYPNRLLYIGLREP